MKITLKLKKGINFNKVIKKMEDNASTVAGYSAYIVSSHIKESMWRAKDTQTGYERERRYDVGGSPAQPGNTIIGSRTDEWPNIEKAKLVKGVFSKRNPKVPGRAHIISHAINKDGEGYAGWMDRRNAFLHRGFKEKKAKILALIQELHTFPNRK